MSNSFDDFSKEFSEVEIMKIIITETYVEGLKCFVEEMEEKIREDLRSLLQYKNDQEILSDKYFDIEFLANRIRYILIILSHTIIETSLREICNWLGCLKGLELKFSDLKKKKEKKKKKGSFLDKVKFYISECGIKKPFESYSWKIIKNNSHIRNLIVHALGDIQNCNETMKTRKIEKIKRIIEQTDGLDLEDGHKLTVDREYIYKLVESIECFFETLFDQIQ